MTSITIEQALGLAVQHHQAGRFNLAEQLYRQILATQPQQADALHLLGVLAHQIQRNDVAIDLIRRAIAARPGWPEAYSNLGNALHAAGKLDEAIEAFGQAIVLAPALAQAQNNLGNVLKDKGIPDAAMAAYRQAIAVDPSYAEAFNNLGNVLKQQGDIDQAVEAYEQSIRLAPGYAQPLNNLGNVLRDRGYFDQATAAFERAIALSADFPEAHNNLGNVLNDVGKLDLAIASFHRAIALRPDYADAHSNLGSALRDKGDISGAVAACRRAIELNPQLPEAHNNLGNALRDEGKFDQATAAFYQAIALNSAYAQPHSNLANLLKDQGELDQAVAEYRCAIALKPDYAAAYINLGSALKDKRQLTAALEQYRKGISLDPDNPKLPSSLLISLHYAGGIDANAIAEEHRRWNEKHGLPLAKFAKPFLNDPRADRRLRIGYVSADFRDHVVGRNILPLMRNHDKNQFQIYCYSQSFSADAVTGEFQQLAHHWRNIFGQSDDQVAQTIREDQIDILVDLSLHTAGNRLMVFARKPAPVQVTFAGYPASTGLTAIDYRLSDPYLDPPGMDESIYSEKTVRLPGSFWCYDPLDCGDIPVNPLPASNAGFITFACLNNFCKISDDILQLWAQVMQQLPNSRLLLFAGQGDHRQQLIDLLGGHNIDPARIEFLPACPRRAFLQLHHQIDLALDSFPYNGHTTSLESFWMGVPVVTLVGQTSVSRAGWCQLSNLGLTELAAVDGSEFVKIAVESAADLPRLAKLRASLRMRMEQSPLMDGKKFALDIEAVYRQMWKNCWY